MLVSTWRVGGNHLPDVKVIRPIFLDGGLVAFAVSLAHWGDIGGAWAGSYFAAATETWQEGVRIPPRACSRPTASTTRQQLLLANLRGPAEARGRYPRPDGGDRPAEARRRALPRSTAPPRLPAPRSTPGRSLRDADARGDRGLPDGVYEGEDFLDDDGAGGEPARMHVKITIAGDEAPFDFRKRRPRPNSQHHALHRDPRSTIRHHGGREIQPNGGLRPLDDHHAAGLDARARHRQGGRRAGNHETSMRIVDAIMRALQDAMPERLSAGGSTTAGILIFAGRGRRLLEMLYEIHGGGEGARPIATACR